MSKPHPSDGGLVELTFRRWLKDLLTNPQPVNRMGVALGFAMAVATTVISVVLFDWLFPEPAGGETAGAGGGGPRVFLPFFGGVMAFTTVLAAMPNSRRTFIPVALLSLLAGIVAEAGMVATLVLVGILVDYYGMSLWFAAPIGLAIGMAPPFAVVLFTAWRFRSPAPLARPPRRDERQQIAITLIALPASLAAGIGFGFVDEWFMPADCIFTPGPALLGFLVVVHNGNSAAMAWRRAGPLRGALLRRCGAGLLIALAAVPLGRLFGCGYWAGIDRFDWGMVFGVLGGYALPVYLAAGALAWWQMDRFLRRHGLGWQDMATTEAEA